MRAKTVDLLLLAELDAGEAGVISLALQERVNTVLIDERKARKNARLVYGLHVMGTARILVEGKRVGAVETVGAALSAMREKGYWIHDDIVDFALLLAVER